MNGWKAIVVTRLRDAVYKFRVDGWNRYTGERFSWRVPNVDRGFDLSDAFFREPLAASHDACGTEGYAGDAGGDVSC